MKRNVNKTRVHEHTTEHNGSSVEKRNERSTNSIQSKDQHQQNSFESEKQCRWGGVSTHNLIKVY